MKTVAVINQKGGVGKTTVSYSMAYELAKAGKKVVIIDLDQQGHASSFFINPDKKYRFVGELFEGRNAKATLNDLTSPAEINGDLVPNLFIVPSDIHLAIIAKNLTVSLRREQILKKALSQVADQYDYCVIDCPPSLGVLSENGITAADHFLIPVGYQRFALDGVSDLFATIEETRDGSSYDYTLVKNMYDPRNKIINRYVEDELAPLNEHVAKTVIRKSESINQAAVEYEPISLYEPKSTGATDFQRLTKELFL